LFTHRPSGRPRRAVGKTAVSSGIIDRVAKGLGRRLFEVPVGFKWFVDGLLHGSLGFGGEESAGRIVPAHRRHHVDHRQGRHRARLLAAEIAARLGVDPGARYVELTGELGAPVYERIDAPSDARTKAAPPAALPRAGRREGAGRRAIRAILTTAPGNGESIGG
jgi:phosphoglucomutase